MMHLASKYCTGIAALVMGCFFLMSCENDMTTVDMLTKKTVGVEEAKVVESYLSQDGYVKAKLTSPYMLRILEKPPYIEFPQSLHVDFFDSLANTESYLDANYAKYLVDDGKVLLQDSVLVVNIRNGDTLKTQKLWWDQTKQQFYTDDTAYIYQPDKTIVALNGLQAAQNLTNIQFFNSRGIIALPQDTAQTAPADATAAPVPADSARK
jgi:LPS export ABC transporter protein LptC